MLFTLVPQKIIHLSKSKYTQDIYENNYKTLMKKKIKIELNKWKDCPWIRRINIAEMSVLLNLIHGFNATPVKISASYFADIVN